MSPTELSAASTRNYRSHLRDQKNRFQYFGIRSENTDDKLVSDGKRCRIQWAANGRQHLEVPLIFDDIQRMHEDLV